MGEVKDRPGSDFFDPVDIELFEFLPEDYPDGYPIRPHYVRINGINCITSGEEGEGVIVHPLVNGGGAPLKVTVTLLASSLKVYGDRSLPSKSTVSEVGDDGE
jgi:hypothetical protein